MWWGKTGKGNDQKKQSERDLDHAKKLHAYRENYADYGIMSDDNESWDINELNITAIRQQKKVIAQEKLFHLTFMYRSLQESE